MICSDTEYNEGPVSGGPWEWWTLGMANPGSDESWEWWTLGVIDPGSGESQPS